MFSRNLRWWLTGVLGLLLVTGGIGCVQPKKAGRADMANAPVVGALGNPWTSTVFNNDPAHFQFIVVSDRTGGVRPGVFEDAVRKINVLQPEFVMSIGDLIMGNTEDRELIDAQWKEFIGFVQQLEMPFYFVPGNHDITNKIMEEEWIKRFRQLYYHFVYQDVLFLCLDSEDPPPTYISQAQRDYVAKALAENPNVRWTLVFLHKPLWDYFEETGWSPIESMLKGRRHTVIAGHRHTYTKFERNDTSYIVLGTTGGGSKLRGRAFGEFDQVAWVTMTDKGPRIANLFLDGIWDENVLTEQMARTMRDALAGKAVTSTPLFKDGEFRGRPSFPGASVELKVSNGANIPMKFYARFRSIDQVHVKPAEARFVLEPNSSETIHVQFEVASPIKVTELAPLAADWTITYEFPGVPAAEINGRQQW